ncbi:MAG: phosphoenolpyruvate carboxykinase (ATP) [Saprospiraceae bacterium]|nr:phosphoenolpyruvate carboxykinase (ATP) [Saprospiraceae bacterium]
MKLKGVVSPKSPVETSGISPQKTVYANLKPSDLVQLSLERKLGNLSDTGALMILTGEFTGRSPQDKFTVEDSLTADAVDWNQFNQKFSKDKFEQLRLKMIQHFNERDIFVQDNFACAHPDFKIGVRLIAELPWSAQFASNMFICPTEEELQNFVPNWTIYNAPEFKANPSVDGTRQHNFSIIDFTRKMILIGGSGYTGEIKKSIFTILNFELPWFKNILPMHCSANIGPEGDTTVFFGLSGTGKTTLSADPNRKLIGDDEHGWASDGVFNFEGGCYAKCIDLTEEKEPDIFHAIRTGAILENVGCFPNTNKPDYSNCAITENTRVSYPIDHIRNAINPSRGGHPKNIVFLTCDAYGILPPISKLTTAQAMYHFISGYTAKVAGTEAGVTEPKATFSACFGAPFIPLHPTHYAKMLGEKIDQYKPQIWLVNTGWTGGPYGVGSRIKLSYTRAMITAALSGELNQVKFKTHDIFGLHFPETCPGVSNEVLDPSTTWANATEYNDKARALAELFNKNFEKYKSKASPDIISAGPKA